MRRTILTRFAVRHPRWSVAGVVLISLAFLVQFPKVTFDNDPENMLAEDEPVRVLHRQVKDRYQLYDFVIVGIVNEDHPDGVFNPGTLGRIDDLTRELDSLHRTEEGRPAVIRPAKAGQPAEVIVPDLKPRGAWKRILAGAFNHNPEDLFQEDGTSAIIRQEVISPGVVDNIRQAEMGQLKIEYLMERPPTTREEALAIRADALGNPLYRGTLVSEDGKALCLYIPIHEKIYSYNVAHLVENLTEDWPDSGDHIYITGLPVAEDTFGVEMLVQMATSAPLAGLVIFLLLLFFFRRLSLVIAPMLVALVTVICTMGLLIGLGFDVHIMSSMIAIFLMPIAVADSVHILSEFYDTYPRIRDRARTVEEVIGHLFMPMLYTSLTTVAGFASLAMTPIPPVRVFGLHVAFGVGLAWVLSMVLIPAYIMLFTSEASLGRTDSRAPRAPRMGRFLERLGAVSHRYDKGILAGAAGILVVAAFGIARIEVNDNPVNWFTRSHRIRVADRVLNEHFGGTYTAYLTLRGADDTALSHLTVLDTLRADARARFAATMPDELSAFEAALRETEVSLGTESEPAAWFAVMADRAGAIDDAAQGGWRILADEINYLDPERLNPETLIASVEGLTHVDEAVRQRFLATGETWSELQGEALLNAALSVCDQNTSMSLREFVFETQAGLQAPLFKRPEILDYVEGLQRFLDAHPIVGKSSSAVDALMKANYELNYLDPAASGSDDIEARNRTFYSIPPTPSAVGQVFTQLEGMKKKDSLFHLVTRDYDEVNLWIQSKSGDNRDMEAVILAAEGYLADHPAPVALDHGWAGLSYLNIVWQDKMVTGMLSALGSSFVVVLLMMIVLFRSFWFGLLSMVPLTVTITFIYGLIGLAGKDYDMPVAVLSALTLGLSVDFAIHFLQRSRELHRQVGNWRDTVGHVFKEPAMAISRNAVVISVGFLPLLVAPLVPYRTVGFFLATIMAVSWMATLVLLPALVTLFQRWLLPNDIPNEKEHRNPS